MKKLLLMAFAAVSCLALLVGFVLLPAPADAAGSSPAKLRVNQANFKGNTDCAYSANQGWICTITLQNVSTSKSLIWSASSQPTSAASVSPTTGTLQAGEKSTVTIFVGNRTCPSSFILKFAGPVNTVKVGWSCTASQLTIDTTDLNQLVNAGGCVPIGVDPSGSPANWQCPVTLNVDNINGQGGLRWASSATLKSCLGNSCNQGPFNNAISPSKGSLFSPSAPEKVLVIIPQVYTCGKALNTYTFTFSGPANKVVASYECTSEVS